MFARITEFKMKPGSKAAATELMHSLKAQIMALDGLHHFINVMNDDGSGYVISIVSDEDTSNANMERVAALWANFADHLEAKPVPTGYDVIASWQN